jgi:hypothetical protein
MGEERNAYRVFVRIPERKGALGRLRHRWEGNIKMYFKELGCAGPDWLHQA